MKKTNRNKMKRMTDRDIELFCKSVDDVLNQITDRVATGKRKKKKEALITSTQ